MAHLLFGSPPPKKNNQQVGVGLVLAEKPEGLVLTSVLPSGAAGKDGRLRIGDILQRIDGQEIKRISHAKVLLLGDPGTSADVAIFRPSTIEKLVFKIYRSDVYANAPSHTPPPRPSTVTYAQTVKVLPIEEVEAEHEQAAMKNKKKEDEQERERDRQRQEEEIQRDMEAKSRQEQQERAQLQELERERVREREREAVALAGQKRIEAQKAAVLAQVCRLRGFFIYHAIA